MPKRIYNAIAISFAITIFLLDSIVKLPIAISIYALIILSFVFFKILSAEVFHAKQKGEPPRECSDDQCDVGIAFYNEDPSLLTSSIYSVLAQTKIKIQKIVVVDDGSAEPRTTQILRQEFSNDERVIIIRLDVNLGKRHALATAFDHFTSPYAVLLDSDTILESNTIVNLLARMSDKVAVVTSNIRALNVNDNWLTRLIDVRYRNAFMVERAAQSTFGSVLCASGVLSLYRVSFLRSIKEEWVSQSFLGKPVQFGDDRRLTVMALRYGDSIIALDAIASTHVPTNLWQFLKQQLRWNKSFIRESILTFHEFGIFTWPGFLSYLDFFFWLFYLLNLFKVIFIGNPASYASFGWTWLAYMLASGVFRNITLIFRQPRLVLLMPFFTVLHILILAPLRVVALATILDTRWGTR